MSNADALADVKRLFFGMRDAISALSVRTGTGAGEWHANIDDGVMFTCNDDDVEDSPLEFDFVDRCGFDDESGSVTWMELHALASVRMHAFAEETTPSNMFSMMLCMDQSKTHDLSRRLAEIQRFLGHCQSVKLRTEHGRIAWAMLLFFGKGKSIEAMSEFYSFLESATDATTNEALALCEKEGWL